MRRSVVRGLGITGALVGLVAGGIGIAAMHEQANKVKCASNLRKIGEAIAQYSMTSKDWAFPDSLDRLQGKLPPDTFTCPDGGSYIYVGGKFNAQVVPSAILAYEDPATSHHGHGGNFLFGDYHAEWKSAEEAQRIVTRIQRGINPPDSDPLPAVSAGKAPTEPTLSAISNEALGLADLCLQGFLGSSNFDPPRATWSKGAPIFGANRRPYVASCPGILAAQYSSGPIKYSQWTTLSVQIDDETTEADRLNGIAWRGSVTYFGQSRRDFPRSNDGSSNGWGAWYMLNASQIVMIDLTKQSGQWHVSNEYGGFFAASRAFTHPNPSPLGPPGELPPQ